MIKVEGVTLPVNNLLLFKICSFNEQLHLFEENGTWLEGDRGLRGEDRVAGERMS